MILWHTVVLPLAVPPAMPIRKQPLLRHRPELAVRSIRGDGVVAPFASAAGSVASVMAGRSLVSVCQAQTSALEFEEGTALAMHRIGIGGGANAGEETVLGRWYDRGLV